MGYHLHGEGELDVEQAPAPGGDEVNAGIVGEVGTPLVAGIGYARLVPTRRSRWSYGAGGRNGIVSPAASAFVWLQAFYSLA